jgi:adenylosuccinate lyase
MMKNLVLYPDNMIANLNLTKGVIFSQMVLLKLVEKGTSREDAYTVVQKNAMKSWEEGIEFKELILKDEWMMTYLARDDVESIFQSSNFLKQIDHIFTRVFGG